MRSFIKPLIASVLISTPVFATAEADQRFEVRNILIAQNATPVTAEGQTKPAETADEKKRVLDVVRNYTQSVNEGDKKPEIIDELWEHSPDISNINIRGHQKGFEDIKANFYAPLFEVLTDRNLRMVTDEREPAVYIFDNTAIVEFYWKIDAKLKQDGRAISGAGRETHVLRKTDGGWKLVHLHYSGMPVKGF